MTNKDIEKAYEDWNTFDRCSAHVCPKQTRQFDVGESVRVGNLNNCVVAEAICGGKAYVIEYNRAKSRDEPVPTDRVGIWWKTIHQVGYWQVDRV